MGEESRLTVVWSSMICLQQIWPWVFSLWCHNTRCGEDRLAELEVVHGLSQHEKAAKVARLIM